MGHSGGAQNIFLWIGSPKCPARAFVSLDTTMEYDEKLPLHQYMRDALKKLTPPQIPVILFAQERLKPRYSAFNEYLRRSPHYEAEVAALTHSDFVAHGYLGRLLVQTPDADTIRRSYEAVCVTIRTFLDATLKADAKAAQELQQGRSSPAVSIHYRPPLLL
jgi:hypothetical protein